MAMVVPFLPANSFKDLMIIFSTRQPAVTIRVSESIKKYYTARKSILGRINEFPTTHDLLYCAFRGQYDCGGRQIVLTQPAVSQQIRNLEEEMGVNLLVRGVRQIKPTLQGQLSLRLRQAHFASDSTGRGCDSDHFSRDHR
jgi:hypothetical protein